MNRALSWAGLKAVAILIFVVLTNEGVVSRIHLLIEQERVVTAMMFLGVWGLCLIALLIAAFQPRPTWRWGWAVAIAATSFAGYGYLRATASQLTVYDIASLWVARGDTSRALDAYAPDVAVALAVALFGLFALGVRPPNTGPLPAALVSRLRLVPVLPIAVILGITLWKSGGGTHALPQQFSPAAMGLVVAAKSATMELPVRRMLTDRPVGPPAIRHIVYLVGESVRPDYIDFTPGNPDTPHLAAHRDRIADFGQAASAGNCSHYSNALLRLGAAKRDVVKTVTTSPTIWQYANKAGFHTVYIDASASLIRNSGNLQNFMTAAERDEIDEFIRIDNVPAPDLDYELSKLIAKIAARPEPTFIYANKNGAHFPYDESYPEAERIDRPVMSDDWGDDLIRKVDSYRNAIRWSVDGFFGDLFGRLDLSHTLVLYTSDHGQNLDPGKLTHCSTETPDPREGLVPLFALSGDPALSEKFHAASRLNRNRANHFAIFPTLVSLFGYDASVLGANYGPNLFEPIATTPRFTSGDIFGLFSHEVNWTPVDLAADHREDRAQTPIAAAGLDKNDERAGSAGANHRTGRY
jgi:lipid A ethanolaminephosphotransferase